MGYTNYWNNEDALDEDYEKEFIELVNTIIGLSGVNIKGPSGTGKPVVKPTEILLNGDRDLGEEHETFGIKLNDCTDRDFCKTNRKPYDVVVKAVLIAAHAYGVLNWRSDSVGPEEEYMAGLELFQKAVKKIYPKGHSE